MSIEAMKLALEALESRCGTNADERLAGGAIPALRTAIQQAEAQQPAMPEPLADHSDHVAEIAARLRLVAKLAGCPDAVPDEDGRAVGCIFSVLGNIRRALESKPATPEPVQADSSEHLRVIASLGAALRRLSFAAQTTGGTNGPDAELQSAIGQAEQALSLGGIWQAMSATDEPVVVQHRKPVIGWKGETIGYTAWMDGKGLDGWPHRELYDRPEPSVPATTEPVEDGIRNAEDELSCAEEVLDAITCEFSDGEFPVTDFNCIGDYITAVVDVFKERLAAQQPATGEPVASRNPFASRCYAMSESHLSGHRLIVGFEKLGDAQDAHEWVARQGRGDFTHPAPSVPDDVARDAERYRFIRDADVSDDLIPDIALYAMESLDEYIDAAMLTAK